MVLAENLQLTEQKQMVIVFSCRVFLLDFGLHLSLTALLLRNFNIQALAKHKQRRGVWYCITSIHYFNSIEAPNISSLIPTIRKRDTFLGKNIARLYFSVPCKKIEIKYTFLVTLNWKWISRRPQKAGEKTFCQQQYLQYVDSIIKFCGKKINFKRI